MMLSTPDATASSTPYWMIGLSTRGSISFGCALVAGKKRVPRPAAGKNALRTFAAGIDSLYMLFRVFCFIRTRRFAQCVACGTLDVSEKLYGLRNCGTMH